MSDLQSATDHHILDIAHDAKGRLRFCATATRADALVGTVIILSEETTDTTRMLHTSAEPSEVSGREFIGKLGLENFVHRACRGVVAAAMRDRNEVPSDPDEREALVRSASEEVCDDVLLRVTELIDEAAEELWQEEENMVPILHCGPVLFQIAVRVGGEVCEGVVAVYDGDEGAYVLPRPDVYGSGVGPMIAVGEVREAEGVLVMGPPTLVSVDYDGELVEIVGADLDLHVGGLLQCLENRDIAGALPLPFALPADPTVRDPKTGEPIEEETHDEPGADE